MEKKQEQGQTRREWVKTAAIIFLVILLILTFFSNTILNRSLPEVSTSEIQGGSITAKVKGTGTVSAIGNTKVSADYTSSVASVKVKEGVEVNEGDQLFIMGEASEELTKAEEELDSYRYSLMRAQNSYPADSSAATIEHYQRLVDDAEYRKEIAIATKDPTLNDRLKELGNQIQAIKDSQEYIDADQAVQNATDNVNNAQILYDEAQTTFTLAQEAYYADPGNDYKKQQYDNEETIYLNAQTSLLKAQAELADATNKYNGLIGRKGGLSDLEIAYQSIIDIAGSDLAQAEADIKENQALLEAAQEAAASNVASNAKSAQSAYIDVLEYSERLEKAEEKVAELSGGEENAIAAPVSGTVTSISVSPGDKVAKDDVMCIIEVPDLGYTMSYSVTNDQAKRIKVGDTATVSNYYWGSDITATVSSIKVDPKNPKTNKLITFTLEGDLNSGSELTVAVGEKSANYDLIVPNSAVRHDSNGDFVLLIVAKNNALGNRYFAKRVSVEVLATDDNNSAISADLSNGDFVITTSSEPIKNGDQVRMADNG